MGTFGDDKASPLQYESGTSSIVQLSATSFADGVVSSISLRARGTAMTGLVWVVRPTGSVAGGVQLLHVAGPVQIALPASAEQLGATTTVPVSIPIKKGDSLAVQLPDNTALETFSNYFNTSGSACASFNGALQAGAVATYMYDCSAGVSPAVSAMVESDFDSDGSSDFNDQCLTDPARHISPCTSLKLEILRQPPARATKGQTFKIAMQLSNNGPAAPVTSAVSIQISSTTSSRARLINPRANCVLSSPFVFQYCKQAGFGAFESKKLYFNVRAKKLGAVRFSSRLEVLDSMNGPIITQGPKVKTTVRKAKPKRKR